MQRNGFNEYFKRSIFFVEAIACKIIVFQYKDKNGALKRF